MYPVNFYSWGLLPINCDSLYLSVSLFNFQDSSLLHDLNSLMDLIRVVDFQLVEVFFFLLKEESNDFQAFHMPNWKPEVLPSV